MLFMAGLQGLPAMDQSGLQALKILLKNCSLFWDTFVQNSIWQHLS